MKAKSGTMKVSPGLMNTRSLVLLATTLLVVSLVLMGAPGVSVAQTVVSTVPVGTCPCAVGVNPTTNKIYVANNVGNTVSVIDGATDTVITGAGYPIPVGTNPIGVGVNPTTNKIYVANWNSNDVSVIDGATDTVITGPGYPIPVGTRPWGVGVNPTTNKIYVANEVGNTVSVIDGATDTVTTTVGVGTNPEAVGVNPTTNKIYVANRLSDDVSVIDGATDTVSTTVGVGTDPCAVGVNPATNKIYAANWTNDNVSVIDGATDTVSKTVGVRNSPQGVGVNPTTNKIYVANWTSDDVSVIDGATDTVSTTVGVGTGPQGVGVNPTTNKIYVANLVSNNVSVIGIGGATLPTWFLAEGTTAWGFDCYVTIENPNNSAVTAQVGYMTDAGLVNGGEVNLPANSQATVNPRGILGDKDFSTKVECKEGKTIAVDRTMTWTGPGAPSPDGHCSIGVTSADTTWYLAEGSSAWGFECWLLIQNPNPTEATAQVTYMIEGAGPQTFQKKIPANQRKTYNMADDIGEKDASIKVTADMPVIPERAMYRNNRRSGHDSIGTTAPATSYYLAEGTTDWGFTTYVLVQNPNPTPTDVTITYMTNSGPVPQAPFNMLANSRKTIRVNDVMPGADFSTQVTGSQPIIAERAMYWGEGTTLGEAAHDSIGLDAPHTTFYLPDGQTTAGRETYTLVMNPNATDVTVEVTYLTPNGTGNVVFQETIGANSRKTFSMADKGINGRAAVLVTCKTAGAKIMVERAMYWNNRGAGTDTIGGYSD